MAKTHTLPAGTMAQALTPAVKPNPSQTTNIIYSDPQDICETYLELHPEFHGRLASAMAFTLDKAILREAKNVLYTYWGEVKGTPELTFNMYCLSLKGTINHDSLYEVDGPLRTMAQLMTIRESWHDVAGKLIGLGYDPQPLPAQVREDNVNAVAKAKEVGNDQELAKIHKANAEFWCDGSPEEVEQYFQDIMTNTAETQMHWAQADQLVEPSILEIISIVGRHIDTQWRFEDLPGRNQSSLMQSAINTSKKLVIKETARMRGQPIAQATLNMVVRRVVTALERSIVKRFSDAGELENVATQESIDLARAKKRAAWNTY